ncbi:protein SYM1 isoform X2 [Elaeis guineensis]|uniref:Protein Mpv17 isoform X2 n=1 Tax=Elaeis guineensis var. tenera TaxID=51953 RepID=A0A6I9RKM3_ELAGV|nr:protein Mpv17 isoform X2 [Elaeis guineensis]
MDALGKGGLFWWNFSPRGHRHRSKRKPKSSSSESINVRGRGWSLADFPLKQATIAASLTLTGDTVAQVRDRWIVHRRGEPDSENKDITSVLLSHDWLRALRMASYGFLLYGPGSQAWYQFLDRCMPKQTLVNLSIKVLLNQIVLGPCVIAVVFAWNNLWLGKLSQLPSKYQKDALPTLFYGFRFWIPVSILNFGVVPLAARVAFMSSCSIFWNFYLSTTMSR